MTDQEFKINPEPASGYWPELIYTLPSCVLLKMKAGLLVLIQWLEPINSIGNHITTFGEQVDGIDWHETLFFRGVKH